MLGTISSLDFAGGSPAPPVASRTLQEEFARKLREDFNFVPIPWLRAADEYGSWFGGTAAGTTARVAFGTVADRRGGRDLPRFWNELDLRGHRVLARHLCDSNSFAIGFSGRLTDYHVRKGFAWQACLKGEKKTPYAVPGTADPLVTKGQNVLDRWRDANLWPLRSREAFRRWRRDGEVFGRFFRRGWDRLAAFRFVEPEQVGSPDGSTDGNRSFGIETDPDDVETRWAYHLWSLEEPGEGEWVDADLVVHLRANVDSTVKRGVSDFYPIYRNLDHVRQLLDTLLVTSIRQAAVAWREKFPTATADQVRGIVPTSPASSALSNPPEATNLPWWYGGPGRSTYNHFPPGTVQRVEGNREFTDGPAAAAVGNFIEAEQASLRACCVRWGLPEYTGSADASNNNFASSLVAGSPFAVAVEGTQLEWGACWERAVALKVLDLAVEAGILTAAERARLDVEVTEPAVVSPKPQEETQRRQVLNQAGVLSLTTWQLQEQLDPRHEIANFEEEAKRKAKLGQPAAPPGQPPANDKPPTPGGDKPPAAGDDKKGDPLGDLLGESAVVVGAAAYATLSESARAGLTAKKVRDKNGHETTVYVRANPEPAGEKKPSLFDQIYADHPPGTDLPRPARDYSATAKTVRGRPASKQLAAATGYRDVARRRRVLKAVANEGELAAAIGGYNLPDSEPADVVHVRDADGKPITNPAVIRHVLRLREHMVKEIKDHRTDPERRKILEHILARQQVHFLEVKTLLTSPKGTVHVSARAMARKNRWAEKYAANFHLVAIDDRKGGKHSGHRVHVYPGTMGGTNHLDRMQKANDLSEVLAHIEGGAR